MNRAIKLTLILGLSFVGSTAIAQQVLYNYDRGTNFSHYRTYKWMATGGANLSPITQKNIRQAIEQQLAIKGLREVERNPDLYLAYRTGLSSKKEVSGWRMGPRWSASVRATASRVEVGTLLVDMYDPATRQLVWRGVVSKALHPSSNAEKNYKNLQKAIAKLFAKYPPKSQR